MYIAVAFDIVELFNLKYDAPGSELVVELLYRYL
jgi:hypothetical protein